MFLRIFGFQLFIKIEFSAFQQKTIKMLLEINRKIDNMSQSIEVASLPRVNTKLDFNQLNKRLKDEEEKTNMVRTLYILFGAAAATVVINSYFFLVFLFVIPEVNTLVILVAMNVVKVKIQFVQIFT